MPVSENLRSQIENLRPWVESETGMTFSGRRFPRLRAAVEKVLEKQGDLVQAELDRVLGNPRQRISFLERLTAELTIGESFYFRNEFHMRALREHVVPAIVKHNVDHKEIRIWSAGCAAGEEPYSIAILLEQTLAAPEQWSFHVLATDLNSQFLERAREGRYRAWSFRQTDIHNDTRYFDVKGNDYILTPRIRRHVRFAYLNLVKDVYPSPLTGTLGLDLIVFRNVAIYLQPEVTKAIIQRFHRALRPGGWLLLGEAEVGVASSNGFDVHRFHNATLFQRKSVRGPSSDDSLPMPVPPLAAIFQPELASATCQSSLPDWLPLPTAAKKVAAPVAATSTADQIHHLLQQRNYADAERTIDRIVGRTDRATARLQYVRGLVACAEIARAREMLDKCSREEPLLIEAQLLKATFAEEDGDLEEAGQAYRRALYVDRKCMIAHFHLALIQQQTGDLIGARRSLEIAAELVVGEDVHQPVPHGDGVCYGRLQEMVAAILNND